MTNAILLHGGFSGPGKYWFSSIRHFLESKGYDVWAPQLPHPDHATLAEWLPFVLQNGTFSGQTILIGHSLGSALSLAVLERVHTPIDKAILVAGFARVRSTMKPENETMLKDSFDWNRIRANARQFVFINSDNDPWGCDASQGAFMRDRLGGRLVVLPGEGHMGSEKFNQPYARFPVLERILDESNSAIIPGQ